MIKIIEKFRVHCCFTVKYRGAARGMYNLKFTVPHEISVVFHNEASYDYHFIIKELANKFEG